MQRPLNADERRQDRAMAGYFAARAGRLTDDQLRANLRTFPNTTDMRMSAIRAEATRRGLTD